MNKIVRIYYSLIENRISSEIFQKLLAELPESITRRINKFSKWEDAQACLLGYSYVRKYVAPTNVSLKSLYINRYGKPFLKGGYYFNISHSHKLVVVANANVDIGVDAESLKELDYKTIIDVVSSEKEKENIFNSPNSFLEFIMLWTKKEACVKLVGKGLSIPLSSFEIDPDNCTVVDGQKIKLIKIEIPSYQYIVHLALPYEEYLSNIEIILNTVDLADLK